MADLVTFMIFAILVLFVIACWMLGTIQVRLKRLEDMMGVDPSVHIDQLPRAHPLKIVKLPYLIAARLFGESVRTVHVAVFIGGWVGLIVVSVVAAYGVVVLAVLVASYLGGFI